jgi:hypothetical protein
MQFVTNAEDYDLNGLTQHVIELGDLAHQQNIINAVDDAVVHCDIRGDDRGIFNLEPIRELDGQGRAFNRDQFTVVLEVALMPDARDNVIGENAAKLRDILQQGGDRAGGQFLKSAVHGGEDRERARTFESINQARCADGSNESFEIGGGDRRFNNICHLKISLEAFTKHYPDRCRDL